MAMANRYDDAEGHVGRSSARSTMTYGVHKLGVGSPDTRRTCQLILGRGVYRVRVRDLVWVSYLETIVFSDWSGSNQGLVQRRVRLQPGPHTSIISLVECQQPVAFTSIVLAQPLLRPLIWRGDRSSHDP